MRCLALNASFEPLTMVPVRRALRLVIDGKAEVVEAEGTPVHSERLAVPRPAVIRLVRFVHVPRRFRRQVTNTFLFARDNYRCQFCGRSQQELRQRECLTRDHLVPLSRGGTNGWIGASSFGGSILRGGGGGGGGGGALISSMIVAVIGFLITSTALRASPLTSA